MSIRILKVESLNLQSKKNDIQKIIMLNYSQLLDSIQIPIQIVCRSENYDINNYKINDRLLYNFLKDYSLKNNIVNKNFYIILNHKNDMLLNSNLKIIKKYLKNINIHFEDTVVNESYEWYKILSLTKSYVKDENYYYKTLWIRDWPYYCNPGWLEFLYNTDMNIDVNCYIYPQDTQKGIKYLRRKLIQFGCNTELDMERTNDEGIFSAELESSSLMLDELRSSAGKLFLSSYYITVKGKTPEELKENFLYTKNLLSSKGILSNDCFLYQHRAYSNNGCAGQDKLDKKYNFTTSSLKCFFPFLSNNICDKKGIYVAKNLSNGDLIFLDIFAREYAVMLILGIMGSGKSFLAKNLIKNLADYGVEITILDRSGEYNIFKEEKNIIIHSKKTFAEYADITRKYINKINIDYENKRKNPRLFLTDEVWAYINNNEYALDFNNMFSEMILEGRKKYLAVCLISQLIESLLLNEAGQTIVKTANITFLMNMKYNEAKLVANEFELNDTQINFLSTADHEGLALINSNCIPFKVETTNERKIKYNTNPREEEAI